MTPPRPNPASPAPEQCILVLQGGGALGAYQAGMFEVLSALHRDPDWVAGISIGAINAALIAGNAPSMRVARLREFWYGVSTGFALPGVDPPLGWRGPLNEVGATQAMLFGAPGFFAPRVPPAPFQPRGTLEAISYYDTTPLRQTLERLVDFDRINSGTTRLSVGAVNVRSGNFAYFDTARQRIDARHIMASGALPPGFAPIEIDGEHYWDGGIVSNTPLQYVLDEPSARRRVVFQVDLFDARGDLPTTLGEVSEREKDIRYSSRTRQNTAYELDRQMIGHAVRRLLEKLPVALRDDPDVQALAGLSCDGEVDVVHLVYRSGEHQSQSKDYDFSRLSIQDHWNDGREDMTQALLDPRWTQRQRSRAEVQLFALADAGADSSPLPSKASP
ncbi:MAG: patatin-like phospholipase family protein [Burkholderiaceae bacterium]